MLNYWPAILERTSCVWKKDVLVTGDCRLLDKKQWIMLAWGWGSGADNSVFSCVCVWTVPRIKTAALRRRQTDTIIHERANSTLLFSSLTPSGRNSPPTGFLLFSQLFRFRGNTVGRLTLGRCRWPWSPFLEWGRWKRGKKPHLVEHLSTINFLRWLLWKTEQELSPSFSFCLSVTKGQEVTGGWADWLLLSTCRCCFHFICLGPSYIDIVFTLEDYLLLSILLGLLSRERLVWVHRGSMQ